MDLSPGSSVALGILVGLVSTCVQSVGLTLQRKSHILEDSKEDYSARRAPYRRRRWQVGMLLFLLANIVGSTIQITTLPLPLLSTLQASGLVFNSLLASALLKESFTRRTAVGTLLVTVGAVLISLFSALPEPSHNLQQLLHLLVEPDFLVWFSLSLVLVAGVLGMTFFLQYFTPVHRRRSGRTRLIRGMSYGLISGILSAHALLLAKSAVELIIRSLTDHSNQFRGYQSWLLILAFLVLALTQLYYLHRGLKLVSTSILYPFVFCIYNITAIMDGLIYFRQMDRLPPLHAGLIALGTVVLLSGVLALSWRLQAEDDSEQDYHNVAAGIPQTAVMPGMGLVYDPDTLTNSPTALTDSSFEDSDANDETVSLLPKKPAATNDTADVKLGRKRKRKRAATMREVRDIWAELGDGSGEAAYGTFDDADSRPSSAGQQRQRQRWRRRPSAGAGADLGAGVQRGAARGSGEGRRRRSTQLTLVGRRQGGMADWYRLDWWRKRRRGVGRDGGGGGGGGGRGGGGSGAEGGPAAL